MNSFENTLAKDARFHFENGLYYQKNFLRHNSFEANYLKLRQKEGRVYSDEVVQQLPAFYGAAPLSDEWKIRKRSADRLARYLKAKKPASITEIGCGNGWLIHYLHQSVTASYCGIDINEPELQQAARSSAHASSSCFVYGNILSGSFDQIKTDTIIVASAAQYFSSLNTFIKQLLPLLTASGEIHILDTPFYSIDEIEGARKRSEHYFMAAGVDSGKLDYYHHGWQSLGSLNYTIAYEPKSLFNKIKNRFTRDSPFPWIIIRKENNE
jgi:ubiquinone/menaquinone biosynthesis C-methylase UbiE